jgi:hypothetical protein
LAATSASFAAVKLIFLVVLGFLAMLAVLVVLTFFQADGFIAFTLLAFSVIEVLSSSGWLGFPSAMPPERMSSMTLVILS